MTVFDMTELLSQPMASHSAVSDPAEVSNPIALHLDATLGVLNPRWLFYAQVYIESTCSHT